MRKYFLLFLLFLMFICFKNIPAQKEYKYFQQKDDNSKNEIYQPVAVIDTSKHENENKLLQQKHFNLQFKLGTKFAEGNYSGTKMGIAIGLSTYANLGKNWFLQPDFLFWSAKTQGSYSPGDVFNVWDISLLCGYKIDIRNFSISLAVGPGGAKSNREKEMMISLKYSLQFYFNITENQKMFLEIQRQLTGNLDVGRSGQTYNPFILSIGIRINFKNE